MAVADEVPGMATGIERRMAELGLSPGTFAARAGLTPQGLGDVRAGRAKRYQARLRYGVARALQWPHDWYERLVAGTDPATFETVEWQTDPAPDERLDRIERQVDRLTEWMEAMRAADPASPRSDRGES